MSPTLVLTPAQRPMKRRLLNCIPSLRWDPHDIPAQDSRTASHSHRTVFSKSKSKSKSREADPQPKIHRRKSRLSISECPDPELDARTHLQGQSMFYAMLPLEIRKMVYEYLMGEETIHLTLGSRQRFGHFLCEDGDDVECGCRVLVGGKKGRRLEGGLLGILTVCRRLYTEAIPHLYTPHIFSLLHPTHLLYLPQRIPLARLDSIRTLRLRWVIRALPYLRRGASTKFAYPEDTANWQRGWQIIANMKGLKDLYVVLVDPTPMNTWLGGWMELEEQLLQDVKTVVAPRWFELMLPYEICDTDFDMGESKVVLKRPDSEQQEEDG